MHGVPVGFIQALAGHAQLSTTLRYMHLTADARHDAIAKLDEVRAVFAAAATGPARGDIMETVKNDSKSSRKTVEAPGIEPDAVAPSQKSAAEQWYQLAETAYRNAWPQTKRYRDRGPATVARVCDTQRHKIGKTLAEKYRWIAGKWGDIAPSRAAFAAATIDEYLRRSTPHLDRVQHGIEWLAGDIAAASSDAAKRLSDTLRAPRPERAATGTDGPPSFPAPMPEHLRRMARGLFSQPAAR